jgi:hypothetical protein
MLHVTHSSECEVLFIIVEGRWRVGRSVIGAATPPGAPDPMIHRLWLWMALISDPQSVVSELLGQWHVVLPVVGAAAPRGVPSPTLWPCDAPTMFVGLLMA